MGGGDSLTAIPAFLTVILAFLTAIPQPVRAIRIPYPTSLPLLPALRLRAVRHRTPRLRAVAVPRASAQHSIQPDFLNALARLLERPRPATPRRPRRVRQLVERRYFAVFHHRPNLIRHPHQAEHPQAHDLIDETGRVADSPCPPSLSPFGRRPGRPWRPKPIRASRLSDPPVPFANPRWDSAATIALMRSFSPVSSTGRTTGLSSCRFPIAHRAVARQDSAWSILSLAMNRCILRSTTAGFPANGSFLSAALRPRPFSLAIPTPKAASALDWGFDRCGMFFRISSVHWYNMDCWLTERSPLGLWYSNHGASASVSQPFLKLLSKSVV